MIFLTIFAIFLICVLVYLSLTTEKKKMLDIFVKFIFIHKILLWLELVPRHEGDFYTIPYTDGSHRWIALIPKRKGPSGFDTITCRGVDVSAVVTKFWGVTRNFHGVKTNPRMIGFDELLVTYFDGKESVTVSSDQTLNDNL